MLTAAVITVSDSGYEGKRKDESGGVCASVLSDNGFDVVERLLLPDDSEALKAAFVRLSDEGVNLVVTTGGTGFSPRDVTPEATLAVAERNVPGVAEAMRFNSMQYTPRAMLGRGVCVIRKKTVIVNLPGSPKACAENLEFAVRPLIHGVNILCCNDGECARHD